ncbi:MAG: hypothetical protein LIP04_07255 [Tannerellaceae bacterium]|nr:hypothetical protein [Tannerellaceae bacterium]
MLILTLCWLHHTGDLWAQWSEKDSVWLKGVLSGKEEIRLRPEVLKAIEAGTLINHDENMNQLLSAPPVLPVTRDFSGAGQVMDTDSLPDYQTVPPSVYQLHQLRQADALKTDRNAFRINSSPLEKTEFQLGHSPVTVAAKAENLFLEEVRDGQRRGSVNAVVKSRFSMEDVLQDIFSKSERAKRRNKKRLMPGNIISC